MAKRSESARGRKQIEEFKLLLAELFARNDQEALALVRESMDVVASVDTDDDGSIYRSALLSHVAVRCPWVLNRAARVVSGGWLS